MGHLGKKIKIAAEAGGQGTAWKDIKKVRGGNNRCKGCNVAWEAMGQKNLTAHFNCRDSDGCPDT